jgi:hypothetical protein
MSFDKHNATYWTPERRAEWWARAEAQGAGAAAYNVVMAATGYDWGASKLARIAQAAAANSVLKTLLSSPDFAAKVAQKRAAMAKSEAA